MSTNIWNPPCATQIGPYQVRPTLHLPNIHTAQVNSPNFFLIQRSEASTIWSAPSHTIKIVARMAGACVKLPIPRITTSAPESSVQAFTTSHSHPVLERTRYAMAPQPTAVSVLSKTCRAWTNGHVSGRWYLDPHTAIGPE